MTATSPFVGHNRLLSIAGFSHWNQPLSMWVATLLTGGVATAVCFAADLPLPPLVTLVGVVIALTQQTAKDIWIVVGLFIVGLAYYYAYLHRARHDRGVPHTLSTDVETVEVD